MYYKIYLNQKQSIKNFFLVMRLSVFLVIFGCGIGYATNAYSQTTVLSLNVENKTIKEVFSEIEKKTEYIFFYSKVILDLERKISINIKNQKIDVILDKMFENTNNNYIISDRQIVITWNPESIPAPTPPPVKEEQQGIPVTGTVTDNSGDPLPGASVVIKGTSKGVVTGVDGSYSITVSDQDAVMVFSFVGFTTQEILVGDQRAVNVTLSEATAEIGEVVVVGFGVQKKATITGAISSISSETLVQSPVANISNSLTGRVTGLLSVQRDGEPGKDQSTLRVRGVGTFSGSSDPLILVDGIESFSFDAIDPNEIEDITILKDASATAVFGVRGANGVIIVTTKRGKTGKPVLSISSNVALVTFTDLRKNLGSYDYARYANEGEKYNSFLTGLYTPMFSDEEIEHYRTGDDPIGYPDVDWVDLLLKPVTMQTQHNINIRGGSDMIKYFVSAGYLFQDGQFKNILADIGYTPQVSYKRFNFRSNFDFNITKRLSVGIDLSSQIGIRVNPGGSTAENIVRVNLGQIYNALPYSSPGVVDGKIIETDVGSIIYQEILTGYNRNFLNNLTTTVKLKYQLDFIANGLSIHGKVSNWNNMNNIKVYWANPQIYKRLTLDDGTVRYIPQREERPFSFSESSGKNRKTYLEVGINYDKTFGAHTVTGLILYNQDKLFDPGLLYGIPHGQQGVVGRVTYDYKMRYMAEFNVGYNGTENFAPGKRFGWFPAYSLGWIVTEEPFFPKNDFVSYIKIRGAYGEVGNDQIGGSRFMYLPDVYEFPPSGNFYSGGFYFGTPGSTYQVYSAAYEGALGNPDLTWERAKKTNVGIDLVLLGNRIRLTADYFYENRNNILVTLASTPAVVGADLPIQNWGKMKNSGYEAEITYNDKTGKFNYWVKGNYTYAHNEILFQDEVPRNHPYLYRTGQSFGQPFGYIVEGFYNTWEEVNDANRPVSSEQNNKIMPGDFRYADINGDGVINQDDYVPVGYPNFPEIIFGMSFGADWKGFDFSILFQGAAHVSRLHSSNIIRPFNANLSTATFIPKYSWTYEKYLNGETVKLPHLSTGSVAQGHDYQSSTFMVQDAKYLRFKNVEIGYRFQNDLLKRIKISSCRIYINGNNLLTWSGMFPGFDPEQLAGATYPLTRTFNLGINIQF